jgi:hypothetical protein
MPRRIVGTIWVIWKTYEIPKEALLSLDSTERPHRKVFAADRLNCPPRSVFFESFFFGKEVEFRNEQGTVFCYEQLLEKCYGLPWSGTFDGFCRLGALTNIDGHPKVRPNYLSTWLRLDELTSKARNAAWDMS